VRLMALLAAAVLLPSLMPDATRGPGTATRAAAAAVDRCTATDTILMEEVRGDDGHVFTMRLDGTRIGEVYTDTGGHPFALDLEHHRAYGRRGLIDLATGAVKPIHASRPLSVVSFVPGRNWVVGIIPRRSENDTARVRVVILDLEADTVVANVLGEAPRAASDGTIFYVAIVDGDSSGPEAREGSLGHADVMRWRNGTIDRLVRVELSQEEGPYAVTEVVPITKDLFVYRIYDEHEYRYYGADGVSFFAEDGRSFTWEHNGFGHGGHKEQFNLTFSADQRYGAFTERNWGELTYLVVADRATNVRTQTKYYGSFPVIHGEYVIFVSDPAFVTKGGKFRQIAHYATYAYHMPTGALCEVARFDHPAGPFW